tara:strand:- start:1568 stop:1903 length:336 start_codon:yes stop_codon:yes gene_type:complete
MKNELEKQLEKLQHSMLIVRMDADATVKRLEAISDELKKSLTNYKDEDLKPVFVSELLPYCNERMKNVLIEYTLLYGEYAKITDVTETRLSCIDGVGKLTLIRFNELIETI